MSKKWFGFGFQLAALLGVIIGAGRVLATSAAMSETEYDAAMKEVRGAFMDLKKNLDGQAGEEAAKNAQKLADVFKKVEEFWTERKQDDAVTFAKAAAGEAAKAAEAAKAGNFTGGLDAHKALQGTCQGCHTAHRERAEDGSYRIKKAMD
jgi:hypothetical protein